MPYVIKSTEDITAIASRLEANIHDYQDHKIICFSITAGHSNRLDFTISQSSDPSQWIADFPKQQEILRNADRSLLMDQVAIKIDKLRSNSFLSFFKKDLTVDVKGGPTLEQLAQDLVSMKAWDQQEKLYEQAFSSLDRESSSDDIKSTLMLEESFSKLTEESSSDDDVDPVPLAADNPAILQKFNQSHALIGVENNKNRDSAISSARSSPKPE